MKPFNLAEAKAGKKVVTRNGREARIICFDSKGHQPIVALLSGSDGKEYPYQHCLNGKFYICGDESGHDLFMATEKKTGWINIYPPAPKIGIYGAVVSNCYYTEEQALAHKSINCLATIEISWEE